MPTPSPLLDHFGPEPTPATFASVAIGPKADIERLTVRDLSFRDPGLAHAFIHALAPGEIGRIVGR